MTDGPLTTDVTDLRSRLDARARDEKKAQLAREAQLTPADIEAAHDDALLENERRSLDFLKRFTIPPVFYEEIPLREDVREWISAFMRGGDEFYKVGPHSRVLCGIPGAGKTHTAWQVIKIMLRRGVTYVDFLKVTHLLEDLTRRGVDPGEAITALNDRSRDLLVLDDLGAEVLTDTKRERLERILDYRHDFRRPVLITTNIPPAQFSERFGGRLASRVAGMCGNPIAFDEVDHRRARQRPVAIQEQLS